MVKGFRLQVGEIPGKGPGERAVRAKSMWLAFQLYGLIVLTLTINVDGHGERSHKNPATIFLKHNYFTSLLAAR